MKEQYTTQVQVKGKGDTKGKAFANALGNVQNTVLKSTQNILLRIEPQDVKVIKAELSVKNEKFLFFSCRGKENLQRRIRYYCERDNH